MRVYARDIPNEQLNEADVAAGERLYMQCIVCHGRQLTGAGGPAPDLRESAVPLERDSFWAVVHDGTLLTMGMPRFEAMTHEQADQLRAYIRAGARAALTRQNSR
jgi:quinohemoprotein ethanol dehydrogenase